MQIIKYIFIFALLTTAARAEESPGAYLAHLGDCTACHTPPGKPEFSGGLPINSPFGTIYSSNITPDKQYGIGEYTLKDFSRALRQGIAKDGHHLYPAMPYTSYAGASDEDVKALYEYFINEVKPINQKPPQTKLSFPFNQRWGISIWNFLYLNDDLFKPQPNYDELWNRGAYLATTMGHCSACHTPRGIAFQEASPSSKSYLTGATLDNWHAPNLRNDKATGLGRWSESDIADFMQTGHGAGTIAFGNMTQVIENSGQYLTEQDRQAIAHYLVSLADHKHEASFTPNPTSPENEHPGAGLYASSCASCHQADGLGKLPSYPKLAGNPALLSKDPTSLIRIVLEGSITAKTATVPIPIKMPAFDKKFNDQQIADVITYTRQSWGNQASAVTARQVEILRKKLEKAVAKSPSSAIPATPPPAPQ